MSTPAQIFDHELNPVKGWGADINVVDKVAALSSTSSAITEGDVCSLNASGEMQLGLASQGMAIFAMNSSTDFDVIGDDGNITGMRNDSDEIAASMSGLVAIGGYELETTEFDTTETYAPNTLLTAGAPGDADEGQLGPGVAYVDDICGVVSDGSRTNE
jgi:hypothetical protein